MDLFSQSITSHDYTARDESQFQLISGAAAHVPLSLPIIVPGTNLELEIK